MACGLVITRLNLYGTACIQPCIGFPAELQEAIEGFEVKLELSKIFVNAYLE